MKHAIVTAGAKGLGRKVTEALLYEGYSVTVSYRNDYQSVIRLREELGLDEHRLHALQVDVTDQEEIKNLFTETIRRFGRLDVLVNNAGPYIFERKKINDYEFDEWGEMVDGNLTAMFTMLKYALPQMRKQQFGRIIAYGYQGVGSAPGWLYRGAYGAAKAGLASLIKTVSLEEAEYGITANMVCPGMIVGEWKESTIAESRKQHDPKTPVGRPGTGEDIARTVLYFASEDADMVTGTILEVTGGVDVIHRRRHE
ncbi:3-oxoacyl-[acyl-carrier protein] reductase [Geomicrobium halophilum]|uniref:3-oxoacyl-[acyl-carrier protein] reductase n=1 Tax=Geomicrobium halophilum TaxID=549000 RepID=A0A841PW58_9BACL|nr:SDR family oxidoreductase [Geomicrobium halophilum]MBB6448162.1 3-oxoacyl-[acyl-carrier protein] reductase [Geomicrobium halophilum]